MLQRNIWTELHLINFPWLSAQIDLQNFWAIRVNLVWDVFSDSENFLDFSDSGAVRWNSVEIEFQNPSLAARPRPSASLIISVNLLIKMSCKRFPSFHSDHYQHARLPAEYLSFSPFHTGQWHTSALCMHPMHTAEKKCGISFVQENMECFESAWNWLLMTTFWYLRKLPYGFMFCPNWSMRQISWANASFSLSGITSVFHSQVSAATSWRDQPCRGTGTQIGTAGMGSKLRKMSILESNSSIYEWNKNLATILKLLSNTNKSWAAHTKSYFYSSLATLNFVQLKINISIHGFTLFALICTVIKSPSNGVKKWELQVAHQLEGWKSIQTKKKEGITGCSAPQWARLVWQCVSICKIYLWNCPLFVPTSVLRNNSMMTGFIWIC